MEKDKNKDKNKENIKRNNKKNSKENKNNDIEEDNEIIFKIITLGDSGVGKTSIINKYITDNYLDNIVSTLGVNFSYKNLIFNKTQKIKLKLIDTCGQEKFRALSKSYFKNTDGVLYVFGLDDKESFDNIKIWMEYFNKECKIEDIPKILVGNKCDLDTDKELDKNIINEFSEKNNIKYFSTSAKKGININELFEAMGKMLYKKEFPLDMQEESIIISGGQTKKSNKCIKCEPDI